MKRFLFFLAVVVGFCLGVHTRAAAVTCTQAFIFQTGQTLTAANLNANPANEVTCINNIDSNNIGAAGIFASQIIPTNTTQATFGGNLAYTFPKGLSSSNGIAVDGNTSPTNGIACGVANTTNCIFKATTGTTTTTGFLFNSSTACHAATDVYFNVDVNGSSQFNSDCQGDLSATGWISLTGTAAAIAMTSCTSGGANAVNFNGHTASCGITSSDVYISGCQCAPGVVAITANAPSTQTTLMQWESGGVQEASISKAGVFATNGAEQCGVPSGYHIECGTVNVASFTCAANTACSFGSAQSYTASYSSAPRCWANNVNASTNAIAGLIFYVATPGTSSLQVSVDGGGTGVSTANVTAYWMCIGV